MHQAKLNELFDDGKRRCGLSWELCLEFFSLSVDQYLNGINEEERPAGLSLVHISTQRRGRARRAVERPQLAVWVCGQAGTSVVDGKDLIVAGRGELEPVTLPRLHQGLAAADPIPGGDGHGPGR